MFALEASGSRSPTVLLARSRAFHLDTAQRNSFARVGVDTDGTDGTVIREKSLKARVWGNFPGHLFHLFHLFQLFHAPRRVCGGARGSVCDTGAFHAKGSSSSAGVRRRIPRQQRNRLFSRRVLVGR